MVAGRPSALHERVADDHVFFWKALVAEPCYWDSKVGALMSMLPRPHKLWAVPFCVRQTHTGASFRPWADDLRFLVKRTLCRATNRRQ